MEANIWSDNIEAVRLAISDNPKLVNATLLNHVNFYPYTPLRYSLGSGNYDVSKLLLSHGANINNDDIIMTLINPYFNIMDLLIEYAEKQHG